MAYGTNNGEDIGGSVKTDVIISAGTMRRFPSYAASGLRVRSFAHVSKAYAHVNRLYGGIRMDSRSSFTVEDVHGQSSVEDTINLSGSTMTSRRG